MTGTPQDALAAAAALRGRRRPPRHLVLPCNPAAPQA
jgi:hypothetical protein